MCVSFFSAGHFLWSFLFWFLTSEIRLLLLPVVFSCYFFKYLQYGLPFESLCFDFYWNNKIWLFLSWDITEAFWDYLPTRLEILSRPKAPKMLQELLTLRNSWVLGQPSCSKIPKDFKRLQKITKDSKNIPKDFKRSQKIPKESKRVHIIPKESKRF